ncbi:MAG: hypothetical protein RLZZ347_224 [Candidatus Parcubacteria bacterium]|jgi:hypothetical protein
METHPHCKPGEIFIGYHSHSLMRASVLPGIRQRTESGENVPMCGASDSNYSHKLATFAPIGIVRELQERALEAGGSLFDTDAITDPSTIAANNLLKKLK